MLLSTDWFFPFWSEIGLDLDSAMKARMQEGCREIVRTVVVGKSVDDEGEFDYVDWTPKAELKAKSILLDLTDKLDAKGAASALLEEWMSRDHDGLTSTLMLSLLTHELIEGVGLNTSPAPDFAIRAAVMEATVSYDLDPSQFAEISMKSTSSWDKYVRSLLDLDEMPDALSVNLVPAVQVHRLRMLWNRVSERLTVRQRQELLSWYRPIAKSRAFHWNLFPASLVGVGTHIFTSEAHLTLMKSHVGWE
ncbi:MAG: hypothetical protein JWN45_37 [Acidobacteriaceae bacterium]|nr:hypothetical protein [Acidobacteriaceae bacterium]